VINKGSRGQFFINKAELKVNKAYIQGIPGVQEKAAYSMNEITTPVTLFTWETAPGISKGKANSALFIPTEKWGKTRYFTHCSSQT